MSVEASNYLAGAGGGVNVIAQGTTTIGVNTTVNVTIPATQFDQNKAYAICSVANGIHAHWPDKPYNSPDMVLPYSAAVRLTSNTNLEVNSGKSYGNYNYGNATVYWTVLGE